MANQNTDSPTWWISNRFAVLLIALLLFLASMPVAAYLENQTASKAGPITIRVSFALVLAAVVLALGDRRFVRIFCLALVIPALILQLLTAAYTHHALEISRHLCSIALVAFAIAALLRSILNSNRIGFNEVNASLCVYLILGVFWAFVFSLIELISPQSFQSSIHQIGPMAQHAEQSATMLYFAFVTLTTLGYGDIAPITPIAKMATLNAAITGQLFLVTLVARMVGLHIAQQSKPNSDPRP